LRLKKINGRKRPAGPYIFLIGRGKDKGIGKTEAIGNWEESGNREVCVDLVIGLNGKNNGGEGKDTGENKTGENNDHPDSQGFEGIGAFGCGRLQKAVLDQHWEGVTKRVKKLEKWRNGGYEKAEGEPLSGSGERERGAPSGRVECRAVLEWGRSNGSNRGG
jgi:hypothetical protein